MDWYDNEGMSHNGSFPDNRRLRSKTLTENGLGYGVGRLPDAAVSASADPGVAHGAVFVRGPSSRKAGFPLGHAVDDEVAMTIDYPSYVDALLALAGAN